MANLTLTFLLYFVVLLLSSSCAESRGTWNSRKFKRGPEELSVTKKLCQQFVNMVNPLKDIEMDPYGPLILKLMNSIRSHMHEGMPTYGVPILDPLSIPKFDIHIQKPQYNVDGTLSDVTVSNLSTFNVTDIQTSAMNMAANITMHIPEFLIKGNYDLKGKAFGVFPIYGKGPFFINPIDVTCQVFAQGGLSNGKVYMKSLDFKVDMKNLRSKFEGIMGGGPISYVTNQFINTMGLAVYHQIEPSIHERVRTIIMDETNRALEGVQFADFPGGGIISTFSKLLYCDV